MIIHEHNGEFYESTIVPLKDSTNELKDLEQSFLRFPTSTNRTKNFIYQGTKVAGNRNELKNLFDIKILQGNSFYEFNGPYSRAYFWQNVPLNMKYSVIKLFEYGIKYPVITEILATYFGYQLKSDSMIDLSHMFSEFKDIEDIRRIMQLRESKRKKDLITDISEEFALILYQLYPVISLSKPQSLSQDEIDWQTVSEDVARKNDEILNLIRKRK